MWLGHRQLPGAPIFVGEQVRAEVSRRAVVNETFQLGERLGDRTDVLTGRAVDGLATTGAIR